MVRFRAWPPIPKARTRFGLFYARPQRQFWRAFADLPRERHPSRNGLFGPPRPLCSLFFSGGLASVREAIHRNHAGLRAGGCGWEPLARGDRITKSWGNCRTLAVLQ